MSGKPLPRGSLVDAEQTMGFVVTALKQEIELRIVHGIPVIARSR